MKNNRLFITTGLISLLNILTIIKQEQNKDKNQTYEDTLLIFCYTNNIEEFKKQHKALTETHNFKKIIFEKNTSNMNDIYLSIEKQFNKIIMPNHSILTPIFMKKYQNTSFYLTEEGLGSYFNNSKINWSIVHKIYYHNYLEKITPINFPSNIEIENLNINIFKELCKNISDKYPLNINLNNKQKTILIAGQYNFINILGNKEKVLNYYYNLIDKLIKLNFKVFFKPHPREANLINNELQNKFNKNFEIINNILPIELYDKNFTAVFSPSSGAAISLPYFFKIPSFCDFFPKAYEKDLLNSKEASSCILIINKFSLNIKVLFKNIKKDTSHKEAMYILNKLFEKNLKEQKHTSYDIDIINNFNYENSITKQSNNIDKLFIKLICFFIFNKEKRKLTRKNLNFKLILWKNRKNKRRIFTYENKLVIYPNFNKKGKI